MNRWDFLEISIPALIFLIILGIFSYFIGELKSFLILLEIGFSVLILVILFIKWINYCMNKSIVMEKEKNGNKN